MKTVSLNSTIAISRFIKSTYKGRVGLENLGNTCYMNSALQCLLHTPQLIYSAVTGQLEREKKPNAMCAEAFRELTLRFAQNEKPDEVERPSKLKKEIAKVLPQFADYNQEDSFEFLMLFVEALNEQLNRVRKKPKYQTLEQDSNNYDLLVISSLINRVKNGLPIVRVGRIA